MAPAQPEPASKRLWLKLPKDVSAVDDARRALLEYLAPLGLDAKVINRLEVVLEELVTNVVRHADEATHLRISAYPCPEGVCLGVEDDGAAFNPLESDAHKAFDTLENAQLGGLGIPLIKRLSRSLEYDRIGLTNRIKAVIAA